MSECHSVDAIADGSSYVDFDGEEKCQECHDPITVCICTPRCPTCWAAIDDEETDRG